ncbi:MAG: hypothetical protein ABH859_05710 [Pseudomonadota bacterium]
MSVNQLNQAGIINEANQILADFGLLDRPAPVSPEPEQTSFDSAQYRRITESNGQIRAGLFGRPQFRGRSEIDVTRLSATLANVDPAVAARVIAELPADIAGQVLAEGINSIDL